MTPRRKSGRDSRGPLTAADYPALETFFSGYLHEDFVQDHGTPQRALRAYRADAGAEEKARFEREARHLLEAAATLPFDAVAGFIRRDLGAAWRPTGIEELEQLLRPAARGSA
jgi:hypothetical protein